MALAETVQSLFGGWPFIDQSFSPNRLLAGVACMRRHKDVSSGSNPKILETYVSAPPILYPSDAPSDPQLHSRNPSATELEKIALALKTISERAPHWAALLELPISYRILSGSSAISSSTAAYPQHVFLHPKALTSIAELEEQLIHELCHNWTYLVEELRPLGVVRPAHTFILPSGTSNKTEIEVLCAGYVAATLMIWYSIQKDFGASEKRCQSLRAYFDGCTQLLPVAGSDLSEHGVELKGRLLRATSHQ